MPAVSIESYAMRSVACPRCGRTVEWSPQNRYRPFCSERCKLIDLGEWATEGYRIPDETAQDVDDPSPSGAEGAGPPQDS